MEIHKLVEALTMAMNVLGPEGFVLTCAMVALWIGARLGVRRLARLDKDLRDVRNDLELAIMECRADSAIDQGATESLRVLFVELRGVLIGAVGNRRAIPEGLRDVDAKYAIWRKERHDEKVRRIARAQAAINTTRENLAREETSNGALT